MFYEIYDNICEAILHVNSYNSSYLILGCVLAFMATNRSATCVESMEV